MGKTACRGNRTQGGYWLESEPQLHCAQSATKTTWCDELDLRLLVKWSLERCIRPQSTWIHRRHVGRAGRQHDEH